MKVTKSTTGPNERTDDATSQHNESANDTSDGMSDEEKNVNNLGFFIETKSDVNSQDEDSENVLLDNDDVESVTDHSHETSVHSNDDVSERNCSGIKMLTLWEIVSGFLERRYAGDIVKVKALYAQTVAYYRAKYAHEDQGGKSEFSDIVTKWPEAQKYGGDTDDTKSDTSARIHGYGNRWREL